MSSGTIAGSYSTMVEVFTNTPDGYLADCPYPPGGEVDVLFISDSSLALVQGPNAGKASCFSAGDLLTTGGDVRQVFTKVGQGTSSNCGFFARSTGRH